MAQQQIKRKIKVPLSNFGINDIKVNTIIKTDSPKNVEKVFLKKREDIINLVISTVEEEMAYITFLFEDDELKNKKRFKRKIKEDIKLNNFNTRITDRNVKTLLITKFNKIKDDINNMITLSKLSNFTKNYFTENPYLESFPVARNMQRKFIFHCGPTNSGKTYSSMQKLKESASGCYLAPLRLLATEVYDELNEQGFPTSLITGEERKIKTGDIFTSSTIEMASFSKEMDVAIIDEIQMIADEQRGWAWTQAVVGIPAKTIILAGSPDALENIKFLVEDILHESLEVIEFTRKNELKVSHFNGYEKGDAIITFSRKNVMLLKNEIENASMIYGSLSPEVRKEEANKFRDGKTDFVIATDAIGMGLNLPIKRIVFTDIEKYNGITREIISSHLLKQIAGRAGRFGKFEEGLVTATNKNYIKVISEALDKKADTKPLDKFQISPNLKAIETIQDIFYIEDIAEVLKQFKLVMLNDKQFEMMNIDSMVEVSHYVCSDLPLDIKFAYCCAPVNLKLGSSTFQIRKWSQRHYKEETIHIEDIEILEGTEGQDTSRKLLYLEDSVKNCNTYLWLNQRYPDIYVDSTNVVKKVSELNNNIIKILEKK